MVRLVLEPGAEEWKAQTNPLSHGSNLLILCLLLFLKITISVSFFLSL